MNKEQKTIKAIQENISRHKRIYKGFHNGDSKEFANAYIKGIEEAENIIKAVIKWEI